MRLDNFQLVSKVQIALNILFALLLSILLIAYFSKSEEIVFVDSARLLNEYAGMQDARKAYQQKAGTWKANIDTLANEVKVTIMDYEQSSAKMTAKERALSQELVRAKQAQLAQYQQAMSTQAREAEQKMTTEVLAQINTYLKKYGEQRGYKIILAATEYGNMAYASDALDVTTEVLNGLNKQHSGQ